MDPSTAIAALIDTGLTEAVIARRVGSTQSTINRVRNRKQQPNYALGRALVELASHSDIFDPHTTSRKPPA